MPRRDKRFLAVAKEADFRLGNMTDVVTVGQMKFFLIDLLDQVQEEFEVMKKIWPDQAHLLNFENFFPEIQNLYMRYIQVFL